MYVQGTKNMIAHIIASFDGCKIPIKGVKSDGDQKCTIYTITYRVFYHNLLITELHYIEILYWWHTWFKSYASLLPENIIISMKNEDEATVNPMSKST